MRETRSCSFLPSRVRRLKDLREARLLVVQGSPMWPSVKPLVGDINWGMGSRVQSEDPLKTLPAAGSSVATQALKVIAPSGTGFHARLPSDTRRRRIE
jgi:hypothetical protein